MDEDRSPSEWPPQDRQGEEPGEYRALIRALLRQTPEERLLGLRRAATFFKAARRLEPLGVGGYERLSQDAVTFEVFGIRIAAASLEDVIASKAASDRPKDRLQLEILREVARETEADGPTS